MRQQHLQQQPVQGFSALLKGENGSFFVLSDNGFGTRGNSSDYILSMYVIKPDFHTASGGSGIIHDDAGPDNSEFILLEIEPLWE